MSSSFRRLFFTNFNQSAIHKYSVSMAQQEEGWPLGLQPLNVRVGLVNRPEFSGSLSFNTSLSASPCSSSDLDTQSTGSFFHDKSITLGSLLGVSSIVELSRRSKRRPDTLGIKKTNRPKSSCFSLCPRDRTDADIHINHNAAASLGHFLALERSRAADEHRRSHSPFIYGPDEFGLAPSFREPNSLFVDGRIAPPQLSPWAGSDDERRQLDHGNGCGIPVLFPCMC